MLSFLEHGAMVGHDTRILTPFFGQGFSPLRFFFTLAHTQSWHNQVPHDSRNQTSAKSHLISEEIDLATKHGDTGEQNWGYTLQHTNQAMNVGISRWCTCQ